MLTRWSAWEGCQTKRTITTAEAHAWLNAATTSAADDAPATAIAQKVKNANKYIELLVYLGLADEPPRPAMQRVMLLSFGLQPQGLLAEWLETFAGGGLAGGRIRRLNRDVLADGR